MKDITELPTIDELQSELETEREVTAQLEERVRAIKVKQETRVAALERDLTEARAALQTLEPDRQRLKEVNGTLRDVNRALREANAAGLADAELVNVAMAAELEALRAARESDRAEIDTILGALAPLVAEDAEDREAKTDA